MDFGIEDAIQVANQIVQASVGRSLTDIEVIILKGAWNRLDYDQIAVQNQYSTSYLSNDIAPKLWRLLSDALGEKVRKSNFKEALKRQWEGGKAEGRRQKTEEEQGSRGRSLQKSEVRSQKSEVKTRHAPTPQLLNSPTPQLTNSSTHQLTNSPTHQLTNSPTKIQNPKSRVPRFFCS